MAASVVVGQPDFISNSPNQGGTASNKTLKYVGDVIVVGQKLIISDYSNSRVLIYNTIPDSNNAPADVVIGQANFSSTSSNRGGAAAANTLSFPGNIASDGTKLFIADSNNNRVLIYNTIPTTSGASADVVVGQPNMSTVSGGTTRSKFDFTWGVDYASGKLLISDGGNQRVLIYNTVPTSDGADADIVVGQSDFTSSSGGTAANKLNSPYAAAIIEGKLFIVESGNNHVLVFNTVPALNGSTASFAIGQQNTSSGSYNQGGAASSRTLSFPVDLAYRNGRLFISDSGNSRVLIYNTLPTANNAAADNVLGQPDMTTTSSPGNPSASVLYDNEGGVFVTSSQLFVGDSSNYRLVIYNDDTPAATLTPAPSSSAPVASAAAPATEPDENLHQGWAHRVMAGAGHVGPAAFIEAVHVPGIGALITDDVHHDGMNVTLNIEQPYRESGQQQPLPWSQGMNTVSEMYAVAYPASFWNSH